MRVRPYDPGRDRDALWALKRAFELELAGATGGDGKRADYEGKLTGEYRRRYLEWVGRCIADDPHCVTVAVPAGESRTASGDGSDDGGPDGDGEADGTNPPGDREAVDGHPGGDGGSDASHRGVEGAAGRAGPVGYVFVLPERLAMVWDAAVLNELYVRPAHRGTGVADDLVDAAVALAREQALPLDRLVLDVDRENDRARAFYRRHGFEHWGEMVAREL